MGKKDEKTILFRDYFGLYKDYYLFLIRTKYSFYRFGALVNQLCESPVFYVGNLDTEDIDGTPVFRILHTLASKQDQTEIFIIENKTTDHQATIIADKTLVEFSLFEQEPYYYIVNKFPPAIVFANAVDYDFLVLVSKDMDYDAAETLIHFKKPVHFGSLDITGLLKPASSTSTKKKSIEFFQRIFQTSSIKAAEFQEEKEKRILGITEIPNANWGGKHKFPPRESNSEHLNLLLRDPSFE